MRYIVKGNKVMGIIENGNPNLKDLKSRGEFIIEQSIVIPFNEAECKDGEVIKHIKTEEEIFAENKELENIKERQLVHNRIYENVRNELIKEGKIKRII